MTQLDDLLSANRAYAVGHTAIPERRPARRLAVVTCMDARIDVLAALGLQVGEALVLRNAGARVTDDVLRSLALGTHALAVEEVVVVQHTRCGVAGVTEQQLRELTRADLEFFTIADHSAALQEDVKLLADTPYLAGITAIAGLVYDVDSGQLAEITRWART